MPDDLQQEKGATFRELHLSGPVLLVPNPWDAGTARLLTEMGFAALATTSAGVANSLGRPDGENRLTRDEVVENAAAIVAATHLPVSADLESCYGATPAEVAETIRLAGSVGLVGGSIEDATGDATSPIRPLEEAVERVAAAAEAAHALAFPFMLTARAENFLYGRADLDDTITRLQAYEAAGADVLYAPALPDLEAIRTVCEAVGKPVNVLATAAHTVPALTDCGVRRISLGSALSRAALGAVRRAAEEIIETGTFTFAGDALPYTQANALMFSEDGG